MSDAVEEELAVLSAIFCRPGEFQLLQHDESGLVLRIQTTAGGEGGVGVSLVFTLPPLYPHLTPDISISSPLLSRGQSQSIRKKLLEQAAELPPEPMVLQLVTWLQECGEVREEERGVEEKGEEEKGEEEWTVVLLLDHMRSRSRYIRLLERWTAQLQLAGTLLLGPRILIILLGSRSSVKEFIHLLKTVKVDVDSSGRKCKERMMKIMCESPSSSSTHSPPGLQVKEYQLVSELTAAFHQLSLTVLYQQYILPLLTD